MLGKPLQFSPGTDFNYSNFGYCVLGRIVEQISGEPFENFVQDQLLAPIGVTGMGVGRTDFSNEAAGEARYYDSPGAPLGHSIFPYGPSRLPEPYGGFYLEAMDSHGAWVASPIDYLRFVLALDGRLGGPLLSADSLAAMVDRPSIPLWQNADSWYGYGWMVNTAGNWWHTGSLPGTATEIVHAQNGFAWAAFFNSRPANADRFFAELDNALWQAFSAVPSWPSTDLFSQYPSQPGSAVPVIAAVTPGSSSAGSSAISLTIYGSAFTPNSLARWNGSERQTTYVSDSRLTVKLAAADLARAGLAGITVLNPVPGGGVSATASFVVGQASGN